MNDITTVVAVDATHIDELRLVWPTWERHRPQLLYQPLLVICDGQRNEKEWHDRLSFVRHPMRRIVLWDMPGIDQRHKMLTSLVLGIAQHVKTSWYLKLDTDVVAYASNDWFSLSWFAPDETGRIPVFISSPWGYTKPPHAIDILDDWANGVAELNQHPPLGLHPKPDASSLGHRRIISWCFYGRTDWTREMAMYCEGQLPIASQDTFLWYCATRRGDFFRTIRMGRLGWKHLQGRRRLIAATKLALEEASDHLPYNPKRNYTTMKPSKEDSPLSHHEGSLSLVTPKHSSEHIAELISLLPGLDLPVMRGAEIGVSLGRTSCALLSHYAHLFLYMVDSWSTYEPHHPYRLSGDREARWTEDQQQQRIQRVIEITDFAAERRCILRHTSHAAADMICNRSLDFVFIDGDHTYDGVRSDLHAWWPKVKPGGLLMGHDYNHTRNRTGLFGVKRAVDDWCRESELEITVGKDIGSVWWVKKRVTA